MKQLRMVFDNVFEQLPQIPCVDGFSLRCFNDKDVSAYNELKVASGFTAVTREQFYKYFSETVLPNGLFFAVENSTGKLAAATSAQVPIHRNFPGVGNIGWVMTRPDFRGKHLGKLVFIAAMHKVRECGYSKITLSTDDNRIPAISMYIKNGFCPWLYEDNMAKRWRNVCSTLKYDYGFIRKYDLNLSPLRLSARRRQTRRCQIFNDFSSV